MITIKVYWGPHATDFPLYSVYSAEHYTVSGIDGNRCQHMIVDNGKHEIELGIGSRTFVMNDRGSTIDTIIIN